MVHLDHVLVVNEFNCSIANAIISPHDHLISIGECLGQCDNTDAGCQCPDCLWLTTAAQQPAPPLNVSSVYLPNLYTPSQTLRFIILLSRLSLVVICLQQPSRKTPAAVPDEKVLKAMLSNSCLVITSYLHFSPHTYIIYIQTPIIWWR
jgi:hypothetical protein